MRKPKTGKFPKSADDCWGVSENVSTLYKLIWVSPSPSLNWKKEFSNPHVVNNFTSTIHVIFSWVNYDFCQCWKTLQNTAIFVIKTLLLEGSSFAGRRPAWRSTILIENIYIYIHASQFSWSQRYVTVRRTLYLDYNLSPIYCLPAKEKEHTFLNRGKQLAHVAQLTAIHLDLAPISHKTSALGQCLTAFWSRASKDSLLE